MDLLTRAIIEGAATALEKRKAQRDKEYKARNVQMLAAGKTPEEENHHLRNQAIYDDAIAAVKDAGKE